MKICDIVQFYSPLGGGVRRYLEDKVHYLGRQPEAEHVVIVPSHRDAVTKREKSTFYEIKSLPLIGSLSYRMLLNRQRILEIVSQERPDILEVGDPYRSAWIGLEASRQFDIPIVAFYHSDFPRALARTIHRFIGSALEAFLARRINAYILDLYNRMNATVVAGRRLEGVLKQCGINNVVRIPLGTDINVFYPNGVDGTLRKDLSLEDGQPLLLFVGRLAREKNIRSLVGMMEELERAPSHRGPCHLLLVGDGENRDYVEKVVAQRRDITWYRYCESPEQLAQYYSQADLFVHAGNHETFGITSLEAQACGTRVLAIRGGGLDDTVEDEEPLVMADSPKPEHLAQGVRMALQAGEADNPEARRQRIVQRFSIELTFTRLMFLYTHILQGKPVDDFSFLEAVGNENGLHHPAVLTG